MPEQAPRYHVQHPMVQNSIKPGQQAAQADACVATLLGFSSSLQQKGLIRVNTLRIVKVFYPTTRAHMVTAYVLA